MITPLHVGMPGANSSLSYVSYSVGLCHPAGSGA